MSYYKPSGKVNLLNLPLGLLVGSALSVLIAFFYIWLGHLLPFIVVKIVLLIVAPFIIVEVTKKSDRVGKNRNRNISRLSMFLFSCTLLYFSWVFFVVIELDRGFPDTIINLWHYVQLTLRAGGYQITTPLSWFTNSTHVTSRLESNIVIGMEALILCFGALIASKFQLLDSMAYCENCSRWTKKMISIKKMYQKNFSKEQLEDMIENGDLTELLNLTDAPPKSKEYYKISLYCCESCEDSDFIRIEKYFIKSTVTVEDIKQSGPIVDYYLVKDKNLISIIGNYESVSAPK